MIGYQRYVFTISVLQRCSGIGATNLICANYILLKPSVGRFDQKKEMKLQPLQIQLMNFRPQTVSISNCFRYDFDFVGVSGVLGPSKRGVGCLDFLGLKFSYPNAMFLVF